MSANKIDVKELARAFNELRANSLSRGYTRPELVTLLKSIGINQNLTQYLITQKHIWRSNRMYSFLKEPVHYSVFENYFAGMRSKKHISYENKKQKVLSEDFNKIKEYWKDDNITPELENLAVLILKKKGYKLLKPRVEYDEL